MGVYNLNRNGSFVLIDTFINLDMNGEAKVTTSLIDPDSKEVSPMFMLYRQ